MPSGEALYFHLRDPSARLTACRSPVCDPTNTTPSEMAADESIASPASYVQRTFSVDGSAAADVPCSGSAPRNCGHRSAGATAGACADSRATADRTMRQAADVWWRTVALRPYFASASAYSWLRFTMKSAPLAGTAVE